MIKLKGLWSGWKINEQSLVSPTGRNYKPKDIEPNTCTQADLAKILGVSRAAIAGRINRGTLPPFDNPTEKTWRIETIQHLFKK